MYRWSNLELKKTTEGEEYREHRTSYKTRTGMTRDVRPFGPKKIVDQGNLIWGNITVINKIFKKLQ